MVHDRIENAGLYAGLGPRFRIALEWLAANGASCAAEEPVAVADGVVARPARYVPHAPDPARFEFHRRFADVQFVAEGEEIVEVAPADALEPAVPYDPGRDIAWFSSDTVRREVRLPAGTFVVLWPHEAHQPGISPADGARRVRKVVVKVAVGEGEGARP